MTALRIHVGDTLEDMGRRSLDAWHRAECGENVCERHLYFDRLETMERVLRRDRLADSFAPPS